MAPPPTDDYLRVHFGALDQMATDLQTGIGRIDSTLGELDTQATNLLSNWDSASQEEYHRNKLEWDAAAATLKGVLENIKRAVEQARLDFIDNENRNRNLFAG